MRKEKMGDVVVLLPGLMGSVLRKDGRELWSTSASALLGAMVSRGGRLRALVLRDDPPDRDDLGDGIVTTRVMPTLHLIPGLWKIDGYARIRETLQAQFEIVEGRNYFEFPYDWRRDNRVAARRLARQAHAWLSRWRESSGNLAARLILIGHSMGGLVARHFLEVLEGWRVTRALVTFGTPFRGSLNAVDTLANGVRLGPLGLMDMSALARSCTSLYQLLPVYPCYDPGDGRLVRVGEARGVPNIDAARARGGLAFHEEMRQAVETHLGSHEYREQGYLPFPIVGIGQPTLLSARRAAQAVETLETYEGVDHSGDGTVPRVSATPLELSDAHREMYAGTKHGSLQNSDAALVHLRGALTSLGLSLGGFRAPAARATRLSLRVADAFWSDEPLRLRVRAEKPRVALKARVVDTGTGHVVARGTLWPADDGSWSFERPPLPAGTYRVTVTGGPGVEPVEDVFAVIRRPSR
jgi:pimeloyl-ACP methyl ester carboxylesterase